MLNKRKIIAGVLALALVVSMCPTNSVYAKKKITPKLSTKTITLNIGASKTIKLKNAPKLSKKKIKKVKWSSSNKKVATVKYSGKYRQNAKITAKSAGTATIKLKYNGKSYNCKVNVSKVDIDVPAKLLNVRYILNGGTNNPSNPSTFDTTTTVKLKDATRDGYDFGGWYTNENFSKDSYVTELTNKFDSDIILFAKWVEKSTNSTTNPTTSENPSTTKPNTEVPTPEPTPSHTHTFSEWTTTKSATCTETGELSRTCSTCGEVETSTIPATGHNFSTTAEVITNATCTTPGKKAYKCQNPGCTEYKDEYVIYPTGHKVTYTTTKEPTCTSKGEKSGTCTVCGAKLTQDIPKVAHKYVDHICSVCGQLDGESAYKVVSLGSSNNTAYAYKDKTTGYYDIYITSTTNSISLPNNYKTYLQDNEVQTTLINSIKFVKPVVFPADSSSLFNGMENLTSLDLSKVNTSNVTNMSKMFYNCKKLNNIDISKFNTSKVKDMSYMFSKSNIYSIDLSTFITNSCTTMEGLFSGCSNVTYITLSDSKTMNNYFITCNVTTFNNMFSSCTSLRRIVGVEYLVTTYVEDMSNMFYNCSSLTDVNFNNVSGSRFRLDNVKDMSYMFDSCLALESIDLSSCKTTHAENMTHMFYNCIGLRKLDISKFNDKVNKIYTFALCKNLTVYISSEYNENESYTGYMYVDGSENVWFVVK